MELRTENTHVLVVGTAGVDIKGRPDSSLISRVSTSGRIRSSVGGVARNIAENLARLEVPTILLSAVGDDSPGQRVLARCSEAGMDVSRVLVCPDERTGHYMAVLTVEGQLDLAISDYKITQRVDPDYLLANEDAFADASIIVIDANLEDAALTTLFDLARKYRVPVCADPTAPALAGRLKPYLSRIHLITPNLSEATILYGKPLPERDLDTVLHMAQEMLESGVKIAVVTLGMNGLVYASGADRGHISAIRTQIRDETGAGDALTAGVIFGLLNEVPLDEALRLGVSAASLTLQSRETVLTNLSQELLYDQLVI